MGLATKRINKFKHRSIQIVQFEEQSENRMKDKNR